MLKTINGNVRRIAYVPNNSIGVVQRAPIVFYLEGDPTQYAVRFVPTYCLEALHLTREGDEISVTMGPPSPTGSDVERWVNKTFEDEQRLAAGVPPPVDVVVRQDPGNGSPDMLQVTGPTVAQTSRLDEGSFSPTRGEVPSGAELERRRKLSYRVLTAADIPAMTWSKEFEQYFLREDGAVVTRDRVAPWGVVTDDGRIKWVGSAEDTENG
jgi:hypothetical protein